MILFLVLFLFLFLFIQNDTCKIMVNCRQCTYPSILPFHGAGFQDHDRLAHTCRTPWSVLQKSGELWARPPVLTAVPSQANHSGFRRVRLRKIARMFRLLGPCFASTTMEESERKASFSSNTAWEHCDAPLQVGHRRCGCRNWRHVNQLEFRRCWRIRHGCVVCVF